MLQRWQQPRCVCGPRLASLDDVGEGDGEERKSDTLVQRVPHSSSTEDMVSCLRHAHHRAGSRSLPKAKAAGSARPPAIICRLVISMTSGRRAWERFTPMLKKRLATYQTAMRVGSALAPVSRPRFA